MPDSPVLAVDTMVDYVVLIEFYEGLPAQLVFLDPCLASLNTHLTIWVNTIDPPYGFHVPLPDLNTFLQHYFHPLCLPTNHGGPARLGTWDQDTWQLLTDLQIPIQLYLYKHNCSCQPLALKVFHMANHVRERALLDALHPSEEEPRELRYYNALHECANHKQQEETEQL